MFFYFILIKCNCSPDLVHLGDLPQVIKVLQPAP